MSNARDISLELARRWRENHGNESMYGQCQRIDGWQWSWIYQGNENIITYPSATAAGNDSHMFTHNINDPAIRPGDSVYWHWDPYGHVGTAIGWDNGRLVVSHTANSGDVIEDLGNNYKFSHADTINLSFWGVSHQNGQNIERSGVDAYNWNGGGGGTGQRLNTQGTAWYWFYGSWDAANGNNVHGGKYTGEPMVNGDYAVLGIDGSNGSINIRANDGESIWIHSSASQYLY